jgi:DNA-binding beta-propeller fold protein YncE
MTLRSLTAALAAPLAVPLALAALPVAAPASAATLFMGSYPDTLLVFEEDKAAVTGKIRLETGLPTAMRLSDDGRRIYVTTITTSGIEVIDTATRKVVSRFSLNDGATRYRFWGGAPDPAGRYFYTVLTKIEKAVDHYTVSKPLYGVVDLKLGKVVRTSEIEKEDERAGGGGYRAGYKVSPDGKYLYMFGEKVMILDVATLKVVDRIDLSKPETTGLESAGFGGTIEPLRTPGQYVSLFTAADPYIHNKTFGVARFDLASRAFSFTPIGPAPEAMAGLQVTPDGKEAYTVVANGKLGNKRCEFWRFDMTTNAVLDKAEFPCRSRFQFGMSGDGRKLYIYGASYDIEVYDAKSLKHETTWDLGNDTTGAGMIATQ